MNTESKPVTQSHLSNAEHRIRLEQPQRPPSPDERLISDPYRVVWLARHHMRKMGPFEVPTRHPSPYLGERTGEILMGFYEEPNGSWWRMSHLETGTPEMRRIDAELLRSWTE